MIIRKLQENVYCVILHKLHTLTLEMLTINSISMSYFLHHIEKMIE